eukprot:14919963-Alexandrium_andersonii.AAC.1
MPDSHHLGYRGGLAKLPLRCQPDKRLKVINDVLTHEMEPLHVAPVLLDEALSRGDRASPLLSKLVGEPVANE